MSLLSPWMLYGLGALVAPVIIHLWQRRRVVRIPFSTLRFLKIAAARTSKSSRLENILLLILRCLLVILLVLATARPVLSTKMARRIGGDVPRTVILAIDHSMSMSCRVNGSARLETAKKEALAVLEDLKPGDEVAVMAVGGPPELLIPEPTLDQRLAREMIGRIVPEETRSDFPAAFHEACKIVSRTNDRYKELYLFTDSQETAWHFDASSVFDKAWNKSLLKLLVVRPDNLNAPNAAVTAVKIPSSVAMPGSTLSGVAVVENFSTDSLHTILEIRLQGERVVQKAVEVGAGASVEIPFEAQLPSMSGEWLKGIASIEEDNLPADDSFFFTLPVYQTPRVLVVEGDHNPDERLGSGFYLKKALVAGAADAIPPNSIGTAELDDASLEGYSVIFLSNVPGLDARALEKLNRYLNARGTVVFFPGDLGSPEALAGIDFLPAKAIGLRNLPPGRLSTTLSLPDDPLVAGTWDRNTPFPPLPQRKLMEWRLGAEAKSVLTFSNGTPFVIAAPRGSGRVFLINASADRAWGDFPLTPGFLPLVQQITRFSAEQRGGSSSFLVGQSLPMASNLPSDRQLSLRSPDGVTTTVRAGEMPFRAEKTGVSGFYEAGEHGKPPLRVFAVNVDRKESNLRSISKEAFLKMVPAEMVAGLDELKNWLARSRGVIPLWPALLLLALALFAAEGILANVMAARRSQGEEQQIRTGRLNKRRFGVSFRSPGNENLS